MYICRECGNVFSEPDYYEESHPYGMGYASEYFSCCPSCRGDFDEATECECCGEYFSYDDLEDGLCPECHAEQEEEDNE